MQLAKAATTATVIVAGGALLLEGFHRSDPAIVLTGIGIVAAGVIGLLVDINLGNSAMRRGDR